MRLLMGGRVGALYFYKYGYRKEKKKKKKKKKNTLLALLAFVHVNKSRVISPQRLQHHTQSCIACSHTKLEPKPLSIPDIIPHRIPSKPNPIQFKISLPFCELHTMIFPQPPPPASLKHFSSCDCPWSSPSSRLS